MKGKRLIVNSDKTTSVEEYEILQIQDTRTYEEKVEALIRERYSLSRELKILRERDEKPLQFVEYNNYVKECIAKVDGETK